MSVYDNEKVNRKLIGKMLSLFNIEYDQAENGQLAVDTMARSRNVTGDPNAPHFGLVIMDLCMPVMDGYEAIETLRRRGLQLPIIALTANALAEGRQKAMDVGATEFATKPILRPTLHAKCTLYLKDKAPGIPAKQTPTKASPEVVPRRHNGQNGIEMGRICADMVPNVDGEAELITLSKIL